MSKLTYNNTAKIVAAILLTITMGLFIFITGLTATLAEEGLYSSSKETFVHNATQSVISDLIDKEWERNYYYEVDIKDFDWYEGSLASSYLDGIGVEITDKKGNIVYSTYNEATEYTGEFSNEIYSEQGDAYYITAHIEKNPPKGCSVSRFSNLINAAYSHKVLIVVLAIINALLSLALFIFLMIAAGRREGKEEIQTHKIDEGYIDVYFAALVCVAIGMISIVKSAANANLPFAIIMLSVEFVIGFLLAIAWCMSASVQIKTGVIIRKSLIGRCCKFVWGFIKACWTTLGRILRAIPYTWKSLVITIAVIIVNIIAVNDGAMGFILIESLILFLLVAYSTMNIAILDEAAERLANGEIGKKVKLDRMFGALKKRAENLNSIDDAVSKAVDKQMKAERFRTELITNVSHDIKTPLTSIINYSELLKHHLDASDDETAKEFLDVILQNSQRLKKLTSDIVEASKASTGAIDVNLERINFGMLVEQGLYEYEEKMIKARLTPVVNIEHDVMIEADGRLMWRIIDNLLSNICKYAMSGTRVYIDIKNVDGKAIGEFKNISNDELNVSTDELMERFVRGDSSRNTEGSGLGLSIADNLAALQKGDLKLEIDGDLFKTRLTFDVLDEETENV